MAWVQAEEAGEEDEDEVLSSTTQEGDGNHTQLALYVDTTIQIIIFHADMMSKIGIQVSQAPGGRQIMLQMQPEPITKGGVKKIRPW